MVVYLCNPSIPETGCELEAILSYTARHRLKEKRKGGMGIGGNAVKNDTVVV
jgi:hypothetical protein